MPALYRTLLVTSLCLIFLVGCKSADKVLFQPSISALSTRLPSLELTVDNGPLANSAGAWPEDPQKLFEREVRMNLTDPEDTARFGYAKLVVTEAATNRVGRALQAFQLATLMTPSLLGLPLEWYQTDIKAELQILSAQGETLATYSGVGKSRIKVAMYHGYSQTQAPRLADLEALRVALAQIKPQLDLDAARLRSALLTAGPINHGTLEAADTPENGSQNPEPVTVKAETTGK
ncbi:hypothetical protein F0P96_13310 [Hymenobacter busanensis]|uniref:Uncharacterized protein n=1 Tax=Hymenobacter busanensis TaxID=2607656 RepID=A0A7L4ZW10_9BACT|nr:hypothetical protein [Hymenobacter busanensis]KAA9332445.1 hypothetical protein F0P96_13310 [Hymenobacter busanensis]QHJ07217.1 hypothetical protein GUY19_07960 [Hymenobacter busanensis]